MGLDMLLVLVGLGGFGLGFFLRGHLVATQGGAGLGVESPSRSASLARIIDDLAARAENEAAVDSLRKLLGTGQAQTPAKQ